MKPAEIHLFHGSIGSGGFGRLKRILIVLFSFSLVILSLAPLIQSGSSHLELAFFLTGYFVVVGFGVSAGNGDILNPYYSVLLLYSLYSCSAISSVVINNPGYYGESVIRTYYLSILLGLVGLIGGYHFGARIKFRSASRWLDKKLKIDQLRFGSALGVVAIAATLTQMQNLRNMLEGGTIRPYTSWALESNVAFRNNAWSGLESYAQGLTAMLFVGAAFFFLVRRRTFLLRVAVIAGMVCYLTVTVMMGQKRGVLCAAFLLLLYVHYRARRIQMWHLVVPTVILYVFAAMISHVRFTTSIPEMVSTGYSMVRENPEILLPMNAGELNGPPITLLDIIDAEERGELRLSWGYTVLTEMMVWIPRGFFPDRPLPLSEEYMRIFFPGEYDLGAGHGFFIPTEGYWAFGITGVLVVMFAYGAFIAALYRIFQANHDCDVVLLIYGLAVFTLVFTGVRTGLIGTLRATIMDTGPFVLLAWFFSGHGHGGVRVSV